MANGGGLGGLTVSRPPPPPGYHYTGGYSGGFLGFGQHPDIAKNPTPKKTPTSPSGNAIPSGTANPGTPGKPPVVSGTGIGLLAVAGLGAIALANTQVGPVVIAALVAAVIWNGNQLVGVIGGKAPAVGTTVTG